MEAVRLKKVKFILTLENFVNRTYKMAAFNKIVTLMSACFD